MVVAIVIAHYIKDRLRGEENMVICLEDLDVINAKNHLIEEKAIHAASMT